MPLTATYLTCKRRLQTPQMSLQGPISKPVIQHIAFPRYILEARQL